MRVAVAGRTLDVREPPLGALRARLGAADDYSASQEFARRARAAGVEILRYESVRDPQRGGAAALLSPAALAVAAPLELQTWLLDVRPRRVTWVCASSLVPAALEFSWQQ
jgi:hypothetical protein